MILLVFPVHLFHEEKRNMEGKRDIPGKRDDLGWGEGKTCLTLRSAQSFHSGDPDLGASSQVFLDSFLRLVLLILHTL